MTKEDLFRILAQMQGALTVLRFEVENDNLSKEQIVNKICNIIEIGT